MRVLSLGGLPALLVTFLWIFNVHAQNPRFDEGDRQKLLNYTLTEGAVKKCTALTQKLRAAQTADPSLGRELDSGPAPGPDIHLDGLANELAKRAPRLAAIIEDGGFSIAEYELCQLVIMFAYTDTVHSISGFAQPRSGYTSAANIQFADDHADLIATALKDQPRLDYVQAHGP